MRAIARSQKTKAYVILQNHLMPPHELPYRPAQIPQMGDGRLERIFLSDRYERNLRRIAWTARANSGALLDASQGMSPPLTGGMCF
jgi:hypothetical protein